LSDSKILAEFAIQNLRYFVLHKKSLKKPLTRLSIRRLPNPPSNAISLNLISKKSWFKKDISLLSVNYYSTRGNTLSFGLMSSKYLS